MSDSPEAAFTLRQSLDTVGALFGPLQAAALMLLWASEVRAVFRVAVSPAMLGVSLLHFGVCEPDRYFRARRTDPIRYVNLGLLS